MRILRSKGTSYTRFEGRLAAASGNDGDASASSEERRPLPSRGLMLKNKSNDRYEGSALWDSNTLPDQLEQDRDLALRQYIQWLDKALKKPRNLRQFDLHSYVARTHLGTCLWDLFADLQFEDVPPQDPEYQRYLKRWQAKVHPYARHEVNWKKPETDDNAKDITEARAASGNASGAAVSKTRWTSVFGVPIDAPGVEAYREAAGKIEDHLRVQEVTIQGEERESKGRPTGYGFINKRGEIITLNATDPRDLEGFEKHRVWSKELEELYARHGDVARQIVDGFRAEPRKGRPRQRIGAALYDHFGKVLQDLSIPEEKRPELWNLHNRIRQFYRSLAESTRLLEALRTADNNKLRFLLPQNMDELLSRVGGKRDASHLSRKNRLGKIIAHSVDLCSGYVGDDFNSLVHKAMDYYTTSVGQSDIKRNEAFVRVLRNAVAFSIRTHATWLEEGVNLYAENSFNADKAGGRKPAYRDLTLNKTAAGALECTKLEKILPHARLIFGARKHEIPRNPTRADETTAALSRTDVLFDGSDQDKEVLWGLLRLAALVRNRSYHFNTKKRFLNTLESGLLRSPASKNELKPLSDPARDGSIVDGSALEKLESLLDYDLKLDARILAQTLHTLRFHQHVPVDKRAANLGMLSRLPASDDRVTPKFMTLLRKGHDLASNDSADLVPDALKPFLHLKLHDLSKDQGSVNHDRIGILRLLYNRAFPNWLEDLERTPAESGRIFREILDNKRKRREVFLQQTKRVLAEDDLLADALLETAGSLVELELAFTSEALYPDEREPDDTLLEEEMTAERAKEAAGRPSNPYVPDRTQQRDETGALQALRCEVYAYLFAEFINKSDFGWIWSMAEPKDTDATQVHADEITRVENDNPGWLRQFYAWLYLVPVDQVAMLQHQFRKTKVLEEKAARDRAALFPEARQTSRDKANVDASSAGNEMSTSRQLFSLIGSSEGKADSLRAIDRVMGLYTRVQAAGFSGEEFGLARQFFADGRTFDELLATGEEGETLMLPGTISGLQQLARLGTLKVLESTFVKHHVTSDEVRTLKEVLKAGTAGPFIDKQALHARLQAAWKEKPRNETQLRQDAEAYRKVAVEVASYNFDIAAARLGDFASTHHLLMNILGRLADFTAIWERDRDCVLLALAYDNDPNLEFSGNGKGDVFVKSSGGTESLQIYWRQSGFVLLHGRAEFLSFTKCADQPWMQRFFGLPKGTAGKRDEHGLDKARQLQRNPELKRQGKMEIKPNIGHRFDVSTIRNDLAHFNVLDHAPDLRQPGRHMARKGFNLSYVMNAVRALMSYDRKFKNAVPKAIADILAKQGIALSWTFNRDRLLNAVLTPVFRAHLDFIRFEDGSRATFALPVVSPRRLSMTRALFDFGTSGYLIDADGGKVLAYPEHVATLCVERGAPGEWPKSRKLASER